MAGGGEGGLVEIIAHGFNRVIENRRIGFSLFGQTEVCSPITYGPQIYFMGMLNIFNTLQTGSTIRFFYSKNDVAVCNLQSPPAV